MFYGLGSRVWGSSDLIFELLWDHEIQISTNDELLHPGRPIRLERLEIGPSDSIGRKYADPSTSLIPQSLVFASAAEVVCHHQHSSVVHLITEFDVPGGGGEGGEAGVGRREEKRGEERTEMVREGFEGQWMYPRGRD